MRASKHPIAPYTLLSSTFGQLVEGKMKKKLLAWASLIAILPATSLAVPTVYTYTGTPYTRFLESDSGMPGAYDTTMSVTGFIALSDSLTPNTTTDFGVPGAPSILSYSFFDGRVTHTNHNATVSPLLIFTTDSSGAISDWQVHLERADALLPNGATFAELNTVGGPTCAFTISCDNAFIAIGGIGGDAALSADLTTGTWTVTAVPEPSAYALFLAGLGLVGLAAKRRKFMRFEFDQMAPN
jgi:hypothetical protein